MSKTKRLYAMRDVMSPRFWRLVLAVPGESIYVGTEGECSKILYCTAREAIASGTVKYGESATIWRTDKITAPFQNAS